MISILACRSSEQQRVRSPHPRAARAPSQSSAAHSPKRLQRRVHTADLEPSRPVLQLAAAALPRRLDRPSSIIAPLRRILHRRMFSSMTSVGAHWCAVRMIRWQHAAHNTTQRASALLPARDSRSCAHCGCTRYSNAPLTDPPDPSERIASLCSAAMRCCAGKQSERVGRPLPVEEAEVLADRPPCGPLWPPHVRAHGMWQS